MLSVSLFCSIFACFTLVQSLPTGAPALACTSMRPEHALHQPKPLEERPFFVSARLDPFHAGRVLVNVSSENRTPFRGIFLQARLTSEDRAFGSWSLPDNKNFRHVDCNEHPLSALTHANKNEKSLPIVFEWNYPESVENVIPFSSYSFYATIVQDFSTFYVKIPSNLIYF